MQTDTAISGLYAAANGRLDWSQAMAQVAQRLDLWVVQVLGIDKRNGQLMFSSYGGEAPPQTSLDYFRYYNTIDPRVAISMATPSDQWMHCHEHFDDAFVARSPFYQDFLIPHGGRYVSATKLIDDADVQFLMAFMGRRERDPVSAADLPLLEQFKHHFTEAFRNFVHLRETYAELGMARELLSQFSYPMLLVDEMGAIWHRNAMAEQLLRQQGPVSERNGYLQFGNAVSQKALAQALHDFQLSAPRQAGQASRKAIGLAMKNGHRLLAFVSALRSDVAIGAFGRAPRALVIFYDTADLQTHTCLQPLIVGECFDLTPAEARVAVQIAAGASLKEIAQRNGTALTTVRTQLHSVMAKAEVERQADLVRVLLALPARG